MKRTIMTIVAILTIAVSANAMSYEQARREALFLTDKMAYELNLDDRQYDAAYEINLDYLMSVTSRDDVYGTYWSRRNLDLGHILLDWQWNAFCAASYFYRPLYWHSGYWHFGVYARYPRRDYFYFGRPTVYISYRGGHSWRSNGGRSYYERHRHDFRPHPDRHHGLRDRWDSGDTRHNNGNSFNSSTRVTVNNNDRNNNSSRPNIGSSKTGGSFSGSRTTGITTRPSSGTSTRPSNGTATGSGSKTGGSFGTSRTTDRNIHSGASTVNLGTADRATSVKPLSDVRSTKIQGTSSTRSNNTFVKSSNSAVRSSNSAVRSNSSGTRNMNTAVRSTGTPTRSNSSAIRSNTSVRSASPHTSSSHHATSGSGNAKRSGSFGNRR